MTSGYVKFNHDRFVWICSDLVREMHYDLTGQYIGQVQDDIIDGGTIYFSANYNVNGLPFVNIPTNVIKSLTKEEMYKAYIKEM